MKSHDPSDLHESTDCPTSVKPVTQVYTAVVFSPSEDKRTEPPAGESRGSHTAGK